MRPVRWTHVVIALALIAAVGIASPVFGIGKGLKKTIRKEVAKQVRKAAGPAGPPGTAGPPGPPGSARAYAQALPHAGFFGDACDGGPDGNECRFFRSEGITSVIRMSTGVYCVAASGISPFEDGPAVAVTVDGTTDHPRGNASAITISGAINPCSSEGAFGVVTHRQPEIAVRNAANNGSVSVAGNANVADDVGFTIAIP